MLFPKLLLLNLYYYGGYPFRRWANRCAMAAHRVPVVVLFYHRIADERTTPWTTSTRSFVRQIRWLSKNFELISLEEAQRRIRSGRNSRPSVSITFDDGYADNCQNAIPLLLGERIPFTYFVTVRNILDGEPFPHDIACGHRLAPNHIDQIRAMAASGIEIGSHGYTHADLGQVTDPKVLEHEVTTARNLLQDEIDRQIRYFAVPFGLHANLNPAVFELARRNGYEGVCSAYGGYNFPGDDPFHLQRFHGDESCVRVKNRVMVDPRETHIPRFVYEAADLPAITEASIV